jgi:ankyrin repeat protein
MANATETRLLDILRNDKVDEMAEYLEGGNPNYVIKGEVPLNLARSKEMAQLLLDKGADTGIITRHHTPILWQAMRSNPEVIKVLLNHNPKLIYDRANWLRDRETLLHKCVRSGTEKSLECIKILLAHKPPIDINGVTDDGDTDAAFTPLDYAVHTNNDKTWDIIELLLDNGAVRRDNRPSNYDIAIREYMAAKKISKFVNNKTNLRRKIKANFAPPNGEGFKSLTRYYKNKMPNSKSSRRRKTRKTRK